MASSRLGPFSSILADKLVLSVFGTSAGLWAVLFFWSESPYSIYLGHSQLGVVTGPIGFIPLASLFLIGWSAMVLAMMLPATFPLVSELRSKAREHSIARRSTFLTVAGTVGLWIPFGIAAYFMDFGIHRAAELPLLQGYSWLLGLSSLALAGLYQFTPTKSGFLADCCSLDEFLHSRRLAGQGDERSFRMGLSYGKRSLGSHWAMMLLMFSLGLQSFPLMLMLGTAMAAEHDSKLGPRLRVPIGLAILALALYVGLASIGV